MNNVFSYFPTVKIGIDEISDGTIIKLCEFCKEKRKENNEKCLKHYRKIFDFDGLHVCPYGFNSYVLKDGNNIDIFTGFRIKGKYDKHKANAKIKKDDNNRIITEDEMNFYIDTYKKIQCLEEENKRTHIFLGNMVHDIRKFNANIKGKSQLILNKSVTKKNKEKIDDYSRNILAMSEYISIKLQEYDYLYAESPFKSGEKIDFNFYKSFDKVRLCLQTEAKKEQKSINIHCNTNCKDVKVYSNADTIAFLIIDNALKYSLNDSNIEINVSEDSTNQIVEVKSHGIYVDKEEIPKLVSRGYRGRGAINSNKTGSGIGLYLVNQLCDANNIELKISTERVLDFNKKSKIKIDEGYFKVLLYIKKQ